MVAGFDGGVDQTFVLEYRLSKTTSWNTFYPKFSGLVYQLLAHGQWFSPASSTIKTGRHDIEHQKSIKSNSINNFIFYMGNKSN
jgi:hypothetical protein